MNLKENQIILIFLFVVAFLIGLFFPTIITSLQEVFSSQLQPLDNTTYNSEVNIVAVTGSGYGEVSQGIVEIKSGQGRVLVDTNPFVEPDTQSSFEISKYIAQAFTQKNLDNSDIIFSVKDVKAVLVGGRSAGAAFTVATIAALQGKKIRTDAAITGTIEENGEIKQVGGIVEKLVAFAETGGKLFLVPPGQSKMIYYTEETRERQKGNIVLLRRVIVPKEIDLGQYAMEEFEMEVKEVANIKEAVKLLVE